MRDMNHSQVTEITKDKGTDAYFAPEMFEGQGGMPSDMWTLGVTFYELLSCKRPFKNNGKRKIGIFEPLPSWVPDCVVNLISSLLSVNPDARPTCK